MLSFKEWPKSYEWRDYVNCKTKLIIYLKKGKVSSTIRGQWFGVGK